MGIKEIGYLIDETKSAETLFGQKFLSFLTSDISIVDKNTNVIKTVTISKPGYNFNGLGFLFIYRTYINYTICENGHFFMS